MVITYNLFTILWGRDSLNCDVIMSTPMLRYGRHSCSLHPSDIIVRVL